MHGDRACGAGLQRIFNGDKAEKLVVMGGFDRYFGFFDGRGKLGFIHSGKFIEYIFDIACRDAATYDVGDGGNFHDRLHRTDDHQNREMRSVVPLVFRRRQDAAFDVVVDHGRCQQSLAVDVKRTEIFFRKSDHLIHIKLEFGQLVPSRNMDFRYGGDGREKKFFVHKFLHAGCAPAVFACSLFTKFL